MKTNPHEITFKVNCFLAEAKNERPPDVLKRPRRDVPGRNAHDAVRGLFAPRGIAGTSRNRAVVVNGRQTHPGQRLNSITHTPGIFFHGAGERFTFMVGVSWKHFGGIMADDAATDFLRNVGICQRRAE